jgi:hypothetical protein
LLPLVGVEEGTLWGGGWWENGWEKCVNFSVGLNVTFSGFLFQKSFDVLKAVNMKVMVLLNMTPYTRKNWFITHLQDQEIAGYLSFLDVTIFT